tara:strand:+ start:290 stop:553 length:264 start_codon:yes stop_codon:yes gene_type:complete
MNAFENAYQFALLFVMDIFAETELVNDRDIYLQVESALRDWDAFAGPRHTNYTPEAYELSDSEWQDCLLSVCETVEARLECKGQLSE